MTAAFALLVPAGVEDAFASIKVRRLTVNGNEATAELRLPAKIRALGAFGFVARDDKVRLKRENGSLAARAARLLTRLRRARRRRDARPPAPRCRP